MTVNGNKIYIYLNFYQHDNVTNTVTKGKIKDKNYKEETTFRFYCSRNANINCNSYQKLKMNGQYRGVEKSC